MTTQQEAIDVKAMAEKGLKGVSKLFLKDLHALPENAFSKDFGGKSRSVADIVYEVNLVTDHVGLTVRGEDLFEWPDEGWIKAPEDLRTKEAVIDAFQESSGKFIATIENFSAEELLEPLQTEDGETNRFERCRFITLHLWYHAGQLNFIQTLLGDDVWHWK